MLSLVLVLLIWIYSGIVGCVLAVAAIVALEIVVFWTNFIPNWFTWALE